jgi:hypothetical protein
MNVVETVAEGDTVATHAQLNPIHCVIRPAHSNSPAPSAPSTPPPMLLQPVAASVPQSPNSLTKILPSNIRCAQEASMFKKARRLFHFFRNECQF